MDESLKVVWSKIKEAWSKNKITLLVLIPVAVLVLLIKFRNLLSRFVVASGKRLMNKTGKESSGLHLEQKAANEAANRIISQIEEKSKNKTPVGEDWNK